ncbi:LAME_0G09054g1_1 [Lachancea meyersii CBS 8951]|uniref:LAME_0G09054g1_1 n=1 Tax=Lachancea meyersii CBS 8951 TaxID=1266667 RepID=A0A1G4K8I0_9SACH|nr:LAME_0G09054g1_1 [Lachancea meyersii CBS 8951]
MRKSHLVVQIGSKVVRIGNCGDHEPLLTHFWSPEDAFDESLITRLFRVWLQNPLMVDCSKTEILVVENLLLPMAKKMLIYRVFTQNLGIAKVTFVPDALMSLVASGLRNGLIVDVGWEHLMVIPVFDLRIIDHGLQISTKGGSWLADQISTVLSTGAESTSEKVIERLLCQAVELTDKDILLRNVIDQEFVGEKAADNFDLDDFPIIPLIMRAYDSLAVDVRESLKKQVVFSGLAFWTPALRTHCELLLPEFRVVESLGPWTGGSLYFEQLIRSDSLERFEKSKPAPNDWHLQKFEVYK